MKKRLTTTIVLGILIGILAFLSSFSPLNRQNDSYVVLTTGTDALKTKALKILKTKCNVCHRKKNPFMVFNERNMARRAAKIYNMVFIERRMPKGDEIRLTHEEYQQLKKWLFTQEIF